MSVILYRCNVCNRDKEVVQNIYGLDIISRCTITRGCRGNMTQVKVLDGYTRSRATKPKADLDDWSSRKILYNHNQHISKSEWYVVHDLGTIPVVSVMAVSNDGIKRQVQPIEIITIDSNATILRFDESISGLAQLRNTQSAYSTQTIPTNTPNNSLIQITKDGELTIGTIQKSITADQYILITIEFTNSSGQTMSFDYIVDDHPSISSAWGDIKVVTLKGKMYTVRTFNIMNQFIISGEVSIGSTLRLTKINNNQPTKSDMVILLSNPPYESVDKIVDKFVDIVTLGDMDLIYDGSNIVVKSEKISQIYPYIKAKG